MKPNAYNADGGIIEKEAPIHVSNVKVLDGKSEKKAAKPAKAEKPAKKETAKKTTKKTAKKESGER